MDKPHKQLESFGTLGDYRDTFSSIEVMEMLAGLNSKIDAKFDALEKTYISQLERQIKLNEETTKTLKERLDDPDKGDWWKQPKETE